MKKLLTLVAAAFMAVGVNAQTEDVIKVTSGNLDWGQMFVDDGVAFVGSGRTFASTDKLTAKAKYAGCNLKDSEDKDLTYARESGTVQTYTIEFGATPPVNLQINVNCIIKNQWGGGHSTMISKPLNIVDNKASFTVSKEDCSYTGWSFKKVVEGEKEKWIQDQEYTDEPQDVTSIVLQACDDDQAKYPAVIKIKSIKRVTIPCYTFDLANVDYTDGVAKADGWGTGFDSKNEGSACVIRHGETTEAWQAQVNFENVYPKGATIKLSMKVKGDKAGSISAELQNPNAFKFNGGKYVSCGGFPDIDLTTEYKEVTVSTVCNGDGATRLLLNLGKYPGTVSIKNLKIVAEGVKQESLTIPSSSFATYAAYYPVNYGSLGLEAYAVKLDTKEKTITLEPIGGQVPAGKAVLLKGAPNQSYRLTTGDGPVAEFDTDLKVSDGTATSSDAVAVYGLATVNGQDGFYKAVGKTIPAKCAYLEIADNGNSAKFYSLGDHSGSTTGITSVKNEAAGNNAPMYNLAGQLVDKGYKGIVIKNGKKIVLK